MFWCDPDAALEALESAVHIGHADMLGDEADRGVRRVEEPDAGGRQLQLTRHVQLRPGLRDALPGDDVHRLAVRLQPLGRDQQAVTAGGQRGAEKPVRVGGAAGRDPLGVESR